MIQSANIDAACLALRAATDGTANALGAASALIAATQACDVALRDELPPQALARLLALIDAAGELLTAHGAPLEFATTDGRA